MVMEEVASSSSSLPLIPLLSPPCILGFLRRKPWLGAEDGGEGAGVLGEGEGRMREMREKLEFFSLLAPFYVKEEEVAKLVFAFLLH